MLRTAGLLCAALAMFSIAGGHWAVLQTVAWAGMLADYSRQTGSVLAGMERTFDGQHPCALCDEIAVAKHRDKSGPQPASAPAADQKFKPGKSEGMLAENGFQARLTVGIRPWFPPAPEAPGARGEAPPVPPPRPRAA